MSHQARDDSRGTRSPSIGLLGCVTIAAVVLVSLAMGALYMRKLYRRHVQEAELIMAGYSGPLPGSGAGMGAAFDVQVFARKYDWHFHYAGPDGVFGATSPKLVSKENPIGLDPGDTHAKDDFVPRELVLPCGPDIRLLSHSADVIHTLGQLQGTFELDCIPGVPGHALLHTPSTPVSGTLRCTTLCGANHKDHQAPFRFVSDADYEGWFNAKVTAVGNAASPTSSSPPTK